MPARDIDDYLARLDEPKRSTLTALRRTILEILPDAEQRIAYGMPAFRVGGKVVAGFAAFQAHLSYFPHSGTVFSQMAPELAGYSFSPGALRFPIDTPLPRPLVRRLIEVRQAEIRNGKRR